MREQDLWTGGIGFAAGLLVACLFGSTKTQQGGCGCGPGGGPGTVQLINPPPTGTNNTLAGFENAKQIGPAATTMGQLDKGSCRRWKQWLTNDYGIPQQYNFMDCGGGTQVFIPGHGWQVLQ